MNVLNRISVRLVTLVAVLVALVASSVASAQVDAGKKAAEARTFTIAVAVAVPDPGQVFLYAPEGFGFFAQEKLKVKVIFSAGGGAALQTVSAGKADFGLSSPENLWNGIAAGMPIRGFALVLTNSIYRNGVGVKSDSPIRSIAELKGKKVGVSSFTSGSYPAAQAKVAAAGLDPKTDVTFVPIGTGGRAANAIQSGQVDAAVTTETQWAQIKALGVSFRFLPKSSKGVDDLPADVLFTKDATIERYPGLSARFARAIMKGTVAALANPNRALNYYYKLYPEPAGALTRQQNMAIMMARLQNMKMISAQKGKWGYMPINLFNEVQKLGLQYGTVKKRQDIYSLFTNRLVKLINAFDPKAVAARAKAGK